MTFTRNQPIEINNEQIQQVRSTYMGAGSSKVVYASNVGIVIEIEPINTAARLVTSIETELYIQEYKPTGVAPISNVAPNTTTTKIWDRSNQRYIDCRACMQMNLPLVVEPFLRLVIKSKSPTRKQKEENFACLFGTLYVDLASRALRNLEEPSLPPDWNLNNIAIYQFGVITVGFGHFLITAHLSLQTKAKKLQSSFGNFFGAIPTFSYNGHFLVPQMNVVLTTLREWNNEMRGNIKSNSLGNNWYGPTFPTQFTKLLLNTLELHSLPQNNPNIEWPPVKNRLHTSRKILHVRPLKPEE